MSVLDHPEVQEYAYTILETFDNAAVDADLEISPFARDAAATLWASTLFEPVRPSPEPHFFVRRQLSERLLEATTAQALVQMRELYPIYEWDEGRRGLVTAVDLVHWLGSLGQEVLSGLGPYPKDPPRR